MIRLSPRLRLLLDQALPGKPLWDLCCDHGLLGMKALEEGQTSEVHFVDRVPSIMERLKERLQEENLVGSLHVQGAESLQCPLEGTVVIAGVGGDRILEILEALDGNGYLTADRLVLSPHKDERVFVEKFSEGLGKRWRLSEPLSVRESGRERPIWVADR